MIKAKTGDVVQVDESVYHNLSQRKYTAIVLWDDDSQPLLTKVDQYKPFWGTYESIIKAVGHIDLEQVVKWMIDREKMQKSIVFCHECRFYNNTGCAKGFGWCERNGNGHGSVDEWYCADGERRNYHETD